MLERAHEVDVFELGVRTYGSDMSFSVSCGACGLGWLHDAQLVLARPGEGLPA